MKIYNPTDIGDRNKLMILRLIKVYDGISRQEISKRMHLSAPAVSNNVAALIRKTGLYMKTAVTIRAWEESRDN